MKLTWLIIVATVAILAFSACSSQPAASTTPPASATATTAAPSNTPPPQASATGTTLGQLSQQGATVYTAKCAGCHGNSGEGLAGPSIIGSKASLAKYNTAQGLLNFVTLTMPRNAPGSLSHQDYLNVVSYLLVQNNEVPANTPFNESQLGNIPLK